MTAICIRLDDVHGRTPLNLLRLLDGEVWGAAPVTLAVVPFPAHGSLGPTATPRESGSTRATLASAAHLDYLHERAASGIDVALHGLTHADHRHADGGAAAELVTVSPQRVAKLEQVLQDWRRRFDTAVLVPPHNYIDLDLSKRLAQCGISVCRAITDSEVAALGLDPRQANNRMTAKKAMPFKHSGRGIELFQTASISAATMNSHQQPEAAAEALLEIASSAGVAVVTFHWWDFVGAAAELFTTYTRCFLHRLETEPGVFFTTISAFAEFLTSPPEAGR